MPEFLPISRADMQRRGWEQCDFVYIIGDGYVDHPSFGHAIISRVLEDAGYKVGIISQPDWKNPASINALGEPRLGFLVMGGNMDSMVNHYTVSKAHRKADAYTPGGVMGKRPDYAVTVYCNLIRRTYRRKPIIIGGIEASLRRLAHYDYWSDKLKRSILLDSQADLLIYGMGERAVVEIANALNDGMDAQDITYIDGTVYKTREPDTSVPSITLPAFPDMQKNPRVYCAQDYERCISYIEDELGLGKAYDIEAQSQLSEILGAAYFECDDYAAAASFFRLSTAGGDITVNAQRDYAVSLGRLGDIDAAGEILSQMYAAGASGDVTDYVQAEIDYAKKEYLDAESGFQAVLNQTQDIALQKRALRSLAEVYRDCAALVRTGSSPIGNPATKAVEVLANGIETYGLRYDSTIWEMLALAYFEAYHTDPSVPQSYLRKAGECFNRVLELGVTKSYLYSNLYTIYYELQEYDLAEQTLDAYAAQYPKDYEPYAFRAMLYITLENRKEQSARDYSAAVEAYETAGQLLRSDDDATYYQQLQSLIQQLQKEGWING